MIEYPAGKKSYEHELICKDCGNEFVGHHRRAYCDDCPPSYTRKYGPPRKNPPRTECVTCKAPIKPWGNRKYCNPCAHDESKWVHDNALARQVTRHAVKIGFLQPPTDFDCVDCGEPAKCYEHRDYNRPLDVEPTCLRCNAKRGRGIPFKAPLRLVHSR